MNSRKCARTGEAELNLGSRCAHPLNAGLTTLPIFFGLFLAGVSPAQQPGTPPPASSSQQFPQLPDAPVPAHPPAPAGRTYPYDESYLIHVGVLCGVGASTSPVATTPTTGCGVGMTLVPLPVFVEVGIMAPQANRSHLTGYVSVDGSIPLAPQSYRYLPISPDGDPRL